MNDVSSLVFSMSRKYVKLCIFLNSEAFCFSAVMIAWYAVVSVFAMSVNVVLGAAVIGLVPSLWYLHDMRFDGSLVLVAKWCCWRYVLIVVSIVCWSWVMSLYAFLGWVCGPSVVLYSSVSHHVLHVMA